MNSRIPGIAVAFLCLCFLLSPKQALAASECQVVFDTSFTEGYENPDGVCSGNGVCNNVTNTCKCDKGFTGASDFINTDGLDCQLQIVVFQGIWGGLLVLHILGQIVSLPKCLQRYRDYKARKDQLQMRGQSYPITKNRGLMTILCYQLVVTPGLIAMCILKIVDTDQRIGVTFGVTFLFFVIKTGFYGATTLFQPALIKTMLRGNGFGNKEKINKIVRVSNTAAIINFISSSLISLLPFVTLYAAEGEITPLSELVWILYLVGQVIILTGYGAQCVYLKKKINEVLDSANTPADSANTIDRARKVLISMQNNVILQAVLNSAIYLAYLFVPFMWNKHDYYLPLSWVAFVILFKKVADTHISANEGSKSKDGSKSKLTTYKSGEVTAAGSYNQGSFSFQKQSDSKHESETGSI